MLKRLVPALILLLAAGAAQAQYGGPGGGGRGGGPGPAARAAARRGPTPVNQLQFVGVVTAIDTETGRITIAYEPVEAINWPAGTQPFPVAKTAMLSIASVGQKVRFNLDSGSISAIALFDPPAAPQ